MRRIALYGGQGGGKSTIGLIATNLFGDAVALVHSAAPLYHLQSLVYEYAGKEIGNGMQDNELLPMLAGQIRRLNPDGLAELVIAAADAAERSARPPRLLLCDDSVVSDRLALLRGQFEFVFVDTADDIRAARRAARGDLNQSGVRPAPDRQADDPVIPNDGALADLEARVEAFLAGVL